MKTFSLGGAVLIISTFSFYQELIAGPIELGLRPNFLISQMKDSVLKRKLKQCEDIEQSVNLFSIGHRGAPLMFPEHTRESYIAAANMGAGILECDVTFTNDLELVCRHSQNDLHKTTNILETELASKCWEKFVPAKNGMEAKAELANPFE